MKPGFGRKLGIVLVLAAGLLAACSDIQPGARIGNAEAVRQRVQARWDAIIADDWHQVYEFATPAYREAYSKKHFFNRYGGQVTREKIEIGKVELEDPERTTARVQLILHFSTSGMGPEGIYRGKSPVRETWVKVDGRWWFVERR